MKGDAQAILAIAASIADGEDLKDINWQQLEAGALTDEERTVLRSLRLIASIGDLHRSTDDEEEQDNITAFFAHRARIVGRIGPAAQARSGPPIAPAADTPSAPASASPSASSPASPLPPRWGHLTPRERVGAGVFGDVYRAFDDQLEREVALKLLRTGTRSADRLAAKVLHEGRLLARVRHPNVVSVHGVEAHGDGVGLWMEFIRGCTLEQLLERQGLFGAREATLIGQDLCRALASVHAAGLVHRDVKAQNVMREEGGRVVLMDFGTGMELRDDETMGVAVPAAGTPLYLAPEVLDGKEATPASDIYSLGVLLYHLVTGGYPVTARSLNELRANHRAGHKRLQDARPDLPDAFVQVVERAISIDPAKRYPSAGAMQEALTRALGIEDAGSGATTDAAVASAASTNGKRWLNLSPWLIALGLIVAAAVIVGTAALVMTRFSAAPPPGPINSIILMPFANVSSADKDLATGIDLLISEQLSMLPGMRIIHYIAPPTGEQGRQLSIAELLQREQADAAVTGSVTWSGSRAQVFAQIMRAGASTPVWTRQFDIAARRAAELPRDVAREVATAAGMRLSPSDSARLNDTGAADAAEPEAFEAYLRGRVKLREATASAVEQAIQQFQQALQRDPQHAPSYAGLARSYILQAVSLRVLPLAQGAALTREAVDHALALDDRLPDAYTALADLHFYMDWDWAGAEEAYKKAIALSPNGGELREKYAMFLASRRRLTDAMQELQRAVSLDPMSPLANAALGMVWHYAQDDAQAERIYRGVLEMDPTLRAAHVGLIRVLVNSGRYTEALTELDRRKPQPPEQEAPIFLGARGVAVAGLGHRADAEQIADTLTQQDSDGTSVDGAAVYAALGEADKALAILEQAVDLKQPKVLFLRLDPRFKSLRAHPRFHALLQRLGLDS